jgi:hypothetical protein
MGKRKVAALFVGLALVVAIPAVAGADGYKWRDHKAPFDFVFGNHMDTHQQAQLTGMDGITGFLYITPSDRTTADGVPIAMHGDCTKNPDGCTVGWEIHGIAGQAEYCGHVHGEHPAWAIDADAMPSQRGFTHFHWMNETPHHDGLVVGDTYDGQLLKLTAVETFVFNHHGEFLVKPGIDFETHANVFAACEDWPHYGGNGGHGH